MFSGVVQRGTEAYRRGIFAVLTSVLGPRRPAASSLDFGSGDGWFAQQMLATGLVSKVTAVEVQPREKCFVQPVLFDGGRLPFPDRSFDLAYSIDVLHHCDDPRASLLDLMRCTSRLLVIKDHTYSSAFCLRMLRLLDAQGNRRFGVPTPYHFQRRWEWLLDRTSGIQAADAHSPRPHVTPEFSAGRPTAFSSSPFGSERKNHVPAGRRP